MNYLVYFLYFFYYQEIGIKMSVDKLIDIFYIDWIRMGIIVVINVLLERKGELMVLVIIKGFKDLLYIGN